MSQFSLLFDGSWILFAVEVVLKATIVLLLATGLTAAMGSASAAWRHRIWCLTFGGLVLLPFLQLATPGWTWQILPERWQYQYTKPSPTGPSIDIANVDEIPSEPKQHALVSDPSAQGNRATWSEDSWKEPAASDLRSEPIGKPLDLAEVVPEPLATTYPPRVWLFAIWCAGVAITLTPLVTGLFGNARLKRRCQVLADTASMRRIGTLCHRIGLVRQPTLLLGRDGLMPMTFGVRRPYIVIPAGAMQWSDERFRSVVLHELAHIKRRDVPLQLFARVVCALYWFHPLAWWGISRMRLDRELSCDDCVLTAGQDSTNYAAELLEIAREHSSQALYTCAALSMARRSQLEGRLLAVLDADRCRSPVGSVRATVLTLASIGIVVGLGWIRPEFRAVAADQLATAALTPAANDGSRLLMTGVVLSPENEPVPGAQIEVIAHDNMGGWNRISPDELTIDRLETQADSSGRFRLEMPRDIARPRRAVNILASAAGSFPAIENVDARLTHADVKLQLLRSKNVRVQLVDPVGNPVSGVTPQIRYLSLDGDEFVGSPHPDGHAITKVWPTFSESDQNGYAEANLPVSTKRVSLAVIDPHIGSHRVDTEISDKPVSVVLDTPSFLRGKVVDAEGVPIAGAEVLLIEEPYRTAKTDADGSFRVARGSTVDTLFEPGKSILHVYPPATSDFLFQATEWEWPNDGIGDAELTIEMERGIAIEGQVVESESGKPVVGARLAFEPQIEDNPHFKESYRSRFTGADMRYVTDAAGRFQMPVCVGPGHLLVNARSLDYLPVETSMGDMWYGEPGLQREYYHGIKLLNLVPGSKPQPIKIELTRGKTLHRDIVRPDGSPAAGMAFAASYLQDKEDINGWLPSIPLTDGKLEVPGFDPKSSTPLLILDSEGNCGAVVSPASGHASPDEPMIRLLPCGAAKFRFLNDKGEPLSDYQPQIHIIFKAGAPATHQIEPDQPLWSDTIIWDNVARPRKIPKTGADGRVVVDGLIPGAAYNLYYVSKEGNWDEGYEFKVRSGETTDVGEVVIPQQDQHSQLDGSSGMIDPFDAWRPFESTADDPWDLRKVAHLHRRAGFGASWNQLQHDLQAGPAQSISQLLEPLEDSPAFIQVSDAMLRAAGGSGEANTYTSDRGARRGVEWWLYRMAYGGDPLGEKLTLFWHNHFATALRGVYSLPLMLRQNATLRKHARGTFGEQLAAIEADPAMLLWLDGGRNQKQHPNENFARELLELFTLGIGNYTEADVREAARGLTGWREGRNNLLQSTKEFTYHEELADSSAKTFLGRTGQWKTPDILRIILEQPATAEHVCRRLYGWFIDESSEPNDELIQPLATEYRASNYSTQHVVGFMLRSKLFFSPAVYRRRIKSPIEFCVGMIRQLEPARSPNLLRLTAASCERQGQKLFDPPSVKGWNGGRAWLNSNTTLMRLNWTAELLAGNRQAAMPKYDVEAFTKTHPIDAAGAADVFCALLVDDNLGDAARRKISSLTESGTSTDLLPVLQLLLQSPEYQLA